MRIPSLQAWAAVCAVAVVAAARAASGQPAPPPPRAIEVVAGDFKFDPEVIQVAEGERVVLNARTADGKAHGLAIKELRVKAALPKTGEVVPIELTAGKAGTYTISCSVYCGRGHSRMRARLVVTPAR
jgi:cytochrome c oxidase subunit 2